MIRFAVDHPVATWMLFAALVVTGLYAVPRLNIEAMPETDLPELTVDTGWSGASPSAILRSVTLPIEEAVAGCHGVEDLDSVSRHGRSTVTVKFKRDTNMEFARLELSERLGAVRRTLPAMVSQPMIRPFVPEELASEDFFSLNLISPLSMNELRDRAETWLLPRFLAIPGVADAELRGGARPLVRILLDLELVERYGLTADGINTRISNLDAIVPAGSIRNAGQEFTVSVRDSASVSLLHNTVLRTIGGQAITLDHVAEVRPDFEDVGYFTRINGDNVISMIITKRSGQNSISVSQDLRDRLPVIEASAPFPIKFEIEEDEGADLEEKLTDLVTRSGIILLMLFVMLVIALKKVRLTGIVILSIVLAILICLSMFYLFGISVNFITISGLTVCFGMLLDNSILVLDAIHRRLSGKKSGEAREALIQGTHEVAFPIMATTLTTVVAFLSFIFMTDRLSLFYVPLAISVGIAMLASIFVAFGWIPVALRGPAEADMRHSQAADDEISLGGISLLWRWALGMVGVTLLGLGGIYLRSILSTNATTVTEALPWAGVAFALLMSVGVFVSFVGGLTRFHIRFWVLPVLLTMGVFYGTYHVFTEKVRTGGFWRPSSPDQIGLYIRRPVGTDVKLSSETMRLFEEEVLPLPEGVHMKATAFGNQAYMEMDFDEDMRNTAYPEMYRNKFIVLAEELGGMFIYIRGFGDPYMKGGMGGNRSNSTVRVTGYNSKELKKISDGVLARLEKNRRVRNALLSDGGRFSRPGTEETVIVLKRDVLAEHRLSMAEMMGHIRRLLGVDNPWHMILDGEDQRLMLTYDDAEEIEYDMIMGRIITTSRGQKVQLGRLISIESRPEISSITRHDQRYSQLINWEYIGTDSMKRRFLSNIVEGIELPYGYTAEDMSGEQVTEEEEEQMRETLYWTIIFIFMAMAAMFESFFLPMLVLLTLPMAMSGVGGIYWASNTEFDTSAQIGLILMFGIVVNNAILLINRFRLQVREIVEEKNLLGNIVPAKGRLGGFDLWRVEASERQAILSRAIGEGVRIQMRSILLTSGTTIAGMIPLVFKSSDSGNDIWNNLALSSIGGLTSSTVLILSAVPALYWMFTRFGWSLAWFGNRFTKAWKHEQENEASQYTPPAQQS
ncbi:MAG: efflux RND transporter permease subunit [bacterium]|nr:efflux RND transporter permease subunit [bacterium]